MAELENYRSTNWVAVLYPEDEIHVKALEKIKEMYDCGYILHDKDVDKNGELKKAHWHIVFCSGKNAKYRNSIAKGLGLTSNYIEKCNNRDKALEYLVHLNNAEKFQYTVEDVYGTMKSRLNELMNNDDRTEGEIVCELIEFIDDYDGFLSVREFSIYCAKSGYWSVFRRSGSVFMTIIKEHNEEIELERRRKLNDEVDKMLEGIAEEEE